jgi:YaiO family outer membrane protein
MSLKPAWTIGMLISLMIPTGLNAVGEGPIGEMEEENIRIIEESDNLRRWTVVPMFSYSVFNKGRESWQEESADIYYQPTKSFVMGGGIDILNRPPSGTDILYSALASWYPWSILEVHGEISLCPDADFSPNQIYRGGFQYQAMPRLGLLFDYDQLNFTGGDISQIKPGLSYWFNDASYLTLRYVRGWAFGDLNYNYYSAALNIGDMPGGGRLTLGFAYGTDPDIEFGTNLTSLSNAYIYTLFYNQPLTRDLNAFAGIQYVYRLNEDNNAELYQQLTPTIGLVWKF